MKDELMDGMYSSVVPHTSIMPMNTYFYRPRENIDVCSIGCALYL